MSDLPFDLVEEILYRVPATSLIRLRSTCKRWNALFKERKFTQNHLRKAAKDSMVLMLKERRVCPVSVNLNVSPPSIEFRDSLGLNDSHSTYEQVDIVKVCHCDGLLLCTTNDNRLVVWNPSLGETRWIQLKDDYKRYYNSNFTLGYIQNNESCRSYKILWIYCETEVWRFEVYDFSSDSWKVLDDINHKSSIIIGRGLSLKGNTYSLAFDLEEKSKMLFSFDFARERFNRLCLPHFQDVRQMVLSVVREEQLSVLNWNRSTSKMEIWITNNIDTEATLSWRLHLDSTRPNCPVPVIFSSLLFDEEKRVVLCCNVNDNGTSKDMVCIIGKDDRHYTEIPYVVSTSIPLLLLLPSQKWRIFLFNYVPSLVQIDISSKVD